MKKMESWSDRQKRYAKMKSKDAENMHPNPGFRWKKTLLVMIVVVILVLVLPHVW